VRQADPECLDAYLRIAPALVDAVRGETGARAVCYATARGYLGQSACDALVRQADPECLDAYLRIAPAVGQLAPAMQLALVDLAAPALAHMGASRYGRFREIIAHALRSDGRIDLREWALVKSLERHVERRFMKGAAAPRATLSSHEAETRTVLAVVASVTHAGPDIAAAFAKGAASAGLRGADMPAAAARTLDALNDAVRTLAGTTFPERARLLEACAAAAAHDGAVSADEFIVLRAAAGALDVPVPALAGSGA